MIKINTLFIIDNANSIYRGLAFEQVLYFASQEKQQTEQTIQSEETASSMLCIWRSLPAVVIGRNQNPFVESNYAFLKENNIDFARRDSGGGTVYQDSENMNFCFINREHHDIKNNLGVLQNALLTLGVDTTIDEKNNMRYEGKKISGSAYRYSRGVQMHHCTLLLNTDLEILQKSIHPEHLLTIESVGIDSNRTDVTNLHISIKTIEEAIVKSCHPDTIVHLNDKDMETYNMTLFQKEVSRLKSKEWLINKTPTFSIKINIFENAFNVIVKKGSVVEIIREENEEHIFQGDLNIFADIFEDIFNESDMGLQKKSDDDTINVIINSIRKKIIGG